MVQGVPLASRAEHDNDGIHGLAISHAWPLPPQRGRLARKEHRLELLPPLVGQRPSTAHVLVVITHQCGSCSKEFLPTGSHQHNLLG
jgi:hypothetical protein